MEGGASFKSLGQLRQVERAVRARGRATARTTQTMSPTRSSSTIVKSCAASVSGARRCASSAAVPTVGWPAKGSSRAGVKILRLAVLGRFRGARDETVSERLNSAAIACMRASSRPSAIEHDCERIAGERRLGEDVEREEAARHRPGPLFPIAASPPDLGLWEAATRNGEVVRQGGPDRGRQRRCGRRPA